MFSWWRNLWSTPKTIDDTDFGRMTYMDSYWEGQCTFPPTGERVEYFVDAGPDGPTDGNRMFLRDICAEYAVLLARAHTVVQTLPADQRPEGTLRPASMDIRNSAFETGQWELTLQDSRDTMFVLRCAGAHPTGTMERFPTWNS